MLDHHPLLAVANDTHFIPRVIKKVMPTAISNIIEGSDLPLTPELIEGVQRYHRFARLGISNEVVDGAAAKSRTYRELVSELYSEYGRQHGKQLAGEKTPDYCRCLPFLHGLFPWAKTIHIIRDGRDVALSTLEWAREGKGPGRFDLWNEEPVATCALWWRWQVSAGRQDGADLGSNQYCEVKYEALVARPDETLRRLVSFLDLPFASEMLAYHVGKQRHHPGLSAKKAWLPPTTGLRDWRTQMEAGDVELFEAIAGDLLSALGYERTLETISPKIAAVAERCRRWGDETMAKRRSKWAKQGISASFY
jgi:hypothetical protein